MVPSNSTTRLWATRLNARRHAQAADFGRTLKDVCSPQLPFPGAFRQTAQDGAEHKFYDAPGAGLDLDRYRHPGGQRYAALAELYRVTRQLLHAGHRPGPGW